MGNPAYIYTNFLNGTDFVSVTASAADTSYPVGNLYDERQSKRFKSTGTSEVLVARFGTSFATGSHSIRACFLDSNLATYSGVIYGTFDYSTNNSVWAGTQDLTATNNEGVLDFAFPVIATAATYLRFQVKCAAGDVCSIGELVIGTPVEFPAQSYDGYANNEIRNVLEFNTPYGQRWSLPRNDAGGYLNQVSMNFQGLSITNKNILRDFYRTVGENPFVYIYNTSDTDCRYMHLIDKNFVWNWLNKDLAAVPSVTMIQEARHL
jgi:hypothetical protein